MIDPTLPLIDLHRHLDGSVRLQTILELGLEHNLPLPARSPSQIRQLQQNALEIAFISPSEKEQLRRKRAI